MIERMPYVSRGGFKLAAALDHFQIDVTGRICLDVGSSTGGFTDCLLQRGAARVWAIDVGPRPARLETCATIRAWWFAKASMRAISQPTDFPEAVRPGRVRRQLHFGHPADSARLCRCSGTVAKW